MRFLKLAAAVVTGAALVVGAGSLAPGQDGGSVAVDVSVDEAAAQLAAAEADVEDLRTQLAVMRLERTEFAERLAQRDARRQRAADDLRAARTNAQQLAVQAYMGAGTSPDLGIDLLTGGDPLDFLYESTLVTDSTSARYRAADYYQELRDEASAAVESTVEHLDALDEAIALTQLAVGEAEDAQRTAAIVLAEAEEAARAARQSAATTSAGEPPPDGFVPLGQWPGGPTYEQWAALRQCESSGNYGAVSPSGLYRGAYQFDLSTWASVGGDGDPAMASPAEQDHRAQVLWSQRGPSPWPICGRYLY